MKLRLVYLGLVVVLLAAVALPAPVSAKAFPDVIQLPVGWQPEGPATGPGSTFYAGSVATGAIFRGDLRTGEGSVFIPPQGHSALGLKVAWRSHQLFVAGGSSGLGSVYSTSSGNLLKAYQLTGATSFINDVILTHWAAYFTNSFQAEFYSVPLGHGGSLPDPSQVKTIPLGGDWVQPAAGQFGANGIAATENGRWLIIVNTAAGALYRVDPQGGEAKLIDLGGANVNFGDGLLLRGRTLYVVQNQLNQIAVVKLSREYTQGQIVDTLTNPNLNVPTTAAFFGGAIYAVNAKFGAPNPDTIPYEVVRVGEGDD